ncbi:ATP-binding protein [Corynebacterium mastitidis]
MDSQELRAVVEQLRSLGTDINKVEVKAAGGGFPKKIIRSLSSFANGHGGTVILGLDEESGFTPAEGFNARSIADALDAVLAEKVVPAIRTQVSIIPFEGTHVVVAEIPEHSPLDKPCWVKSAMSKYQGSYIRGGHDGDRLLKPYEIDRLEENKIQPKWDTEIVPEATLEDCDPDILKSILSRERALHPNVFGKLNDEKALKSLQIIKEDSSGHLRPTLAGLLAAGTYPQQFFPRLAVTFSAYPGTTKSSDARGQRFLDNATFVGPIPTLVEEAVQAVTRNMRTGGVIEGSFRKDLPDYPPVAIREAVTNALMHRDYSPQAHGSQVQVDMFIDRLEITNPGGLFGTVTLDNLGKSGISSSRNQRLSALLEVTPAPGPEQRFVAENRGTGYAEILDQLQQQLLPPPTVRDSLTAFTLTFERRRHTEPERAASRSGGNRQSILQYLDAHHSASTRELAAATGLSANGVRRIIGLLVEEGIVERTEPLRSPKQRYRILR